MTDALDAARRIVDEYDSPECTGPQFLRFMEICVTTADTVAMAQALLAEAARREALEQRCQALTDALGADYEWVFDNCNHLDADEMMRNRPAGSTGEGHE